MKLQFDWAPTWSADNLSLAKLDGLGIRYFNLAPFHDEPKLFHLAVLFTEGQDEDALHRAGGSSLDFPRAATKAVAEAIERRAAAAPLVPSCRRSYRDLAARGEDALNPLDFRIVESPKVPSDDDVVSWVSGYRLETGTARSCLIPQQLVSLPYLPDQPEPIWMQMTSNGLAAGYSVESACYSAIAEVAERHALMQAWVYGSPFCQASPSHPGPHLSNLLETTHKYKLEPTFYRLATPGGLITVLCILRDGSGIGPWASLGLKAGIEEESCCLGALEEAHQLRPWLRELLLELKPPPEQLRTIQDRARWWLTDEAQTSTADFERRCTGQDCIDPAGSRRAHSLGDVLAALAAEDMAVYVAPLNSQEQNVAVVRAVIPEMTQIYFDERSRIVQAGRAEAVRTLHPLL